MNILLERSHQLQQTEGRKGDEESDERSEYTTGEKPPASTDRKERKRDEESDERFEILSSTDSPPKVTLKREEATDCKQTKGKQGKLTQES